MAHKQNKMLQAELKKIATARMATKRFEKKQKAKKKLVPDPIKEEDKIEADAHNIELARRVLARRRLLEFIKQFHPRYKAGWVHADICRRLEKFSQDVEKAAREQKQGPRLMLLMPPRHGKSQIASKLFPAWHLGHFPHHEFIGCSYNISLALEFSREVRDVIKTDQYHKLFPNTILNESIQGAETWKLASPTGVGVGGYVAAGVGGGITGKGAHCVLSGTMVSTPEGSKSIDRLYEMGGWVNTPLGVKKILAATKNKVQELYRLTTKRGYSIIGTGEHPMYILELGGYASLKDLYGQTKDITTTNMSVVLEDISTPEIRNKQDGEAWTQRYILQQNLQPETSRCQEHKEVPYMQQSSNYKRKGERGEVLLKNLYPQQKETTTKKLPGMQRGISAEDFQTGLLHEYLRGQSPQEKNDRYWEFTLQGRQIVHFFIRQDESIDKGKGQRLCGVHDEGETGLPPYRREHNKQHPRESNNALHCTSYDTPQIEYDTISSIECISEGTYTVYDLQIEDSGCFFANQILTGNCLVIDDPVKNAEEADSLDIREKIWSWYRSTAYSRLAPGGGVLLVQTCWHDDDLAGRLQKAMEDTRTLEDDDENKFDQFEVIKYPAIAIEDEEFRVAGEALHPERYNLEALKKIKAVQGPRYWAALYQQDPVPDEGQFFKKEYFVYRNETPQEVDMDIYQAWDFAVSDKHMKGNNWTVGVTIGLDHEDTAHVLERVRLKTNDYGIVEDEIINMYNRYRRVNQFGGEDGQIWRTMMHSLKRRMRERQVYIPIDDKNPLKAISSKEVRARPLQARMQNRKVTFPRGAVWVDEMIKEFLRFPSGTQDDQIDAMAWCVQLLLGKAPPRGPQKPRNRLEKTVEQQLKGLRKGSNGLQNHLLA